MRRIIHENIEMWRYEGYHPNRRQQAQGHCQQLHSNCNWDSIEDHSRANIVHMHSSSFLNPYERVMMKMRRQSMVCTWVENTITTKIGTWVPLWIRAKTTRVTCVHLMTPISNSSTVNTEIPLRTMKENEHDWFVFIWWSCSFEHIPARQ